MIIQAIKKYAPFEIKRIAKHVLKHPLPRNNVLGFRSHEDTHEILRIETPESALKEVAKNNWLATYARNITSQGGEDGIIERILEVIGKNNPGWCVEFGACDGKRDSNTWHLLNNKGWSGVLIEPVAEWYAGLKENYKNRTDVYCLNRFVNWEGVDTLDNIFSETPLPEDFELLVVDIDGNDAHVFEAMQNYRPHVVSIEFHRLINPAVRFTPPKDFSLNWSASLGALYDLAKVKGYELVCAINWNAFFVRRDHFGKFGISDNRPEKIYHTHEEMRLFQGYDGTLRLCGIDTFYWKYQINREGKLENVRISHSDIQVLPEHLRVFRPRHTYECKTFATQAGKLDHGSFPDNILLAKRRNITSECGEDGILEFIFDTLGIRNGFAVDVGACDGRYFSQSYNLLSNHGWQGIAIEKDPQAYAKLLENFSGKKDIRCLHAEVTRFGITSLDNILTQYDTPHKFDFLTIDIEGDDYHIWNSLKDFSPAVVAVDFNPSISNDILYVQSYNAPSPFGASLKAFIGLGRTKGYELAAVTDWNAIFVRKDLFGKLGVKDNSIDNMYYPPFEMRMMQTMDSCLHLLTGKRLMRQDYDINFENFQVMPQSLRGLGKVFGGTPTVFYGD